MSNVVEFPNQLIDDSLAKEGLSRELVNMVDLDVAYSPVIAVRGESIEQAVEAVKTMGGQYIVRHPLFDRAVSAEALMVMRCRYLVANGERWRQHLAAKGLFGF